jgi:hypothetical protein
VIIMQEGNFKSSHYECPVKVIRLQIEAIDISALLPDLI